MGKKTHAEFVREMAIINPNIKIIGQYINNITPIECLCLVHNKKWDTSIPKTLKKGKGCPDCGNERRKEKLSRPKAGVNDLASVAPDLAKEWHPTENAPLTPKDVAVNSNKKRIWHCSVCTGDYPAWHNNIN